MFYRAHYAHLPTSRVGLHTLKEANRHIRTRGHQKRPVADALRVSLGETDSRGGARTGARPEPTCWCALLFPIEHKKNVAYDIDFDFFNPEESVLLGLARGMQVTLEPGDVLFLAACRRKSQ